MHPAIIAKQRQIVAQRRALAKAGLRSDPFPTEEEVLQTLFLEHYMPVIERWAALCITSGISDHDLSDACQNARYGPPGGVLPHHVLLWHKRIVSRRSTWQHLDQDQAWLGQIEEVLAWPKQYGKEALQDGPWAVLLFLNTLKNIVWLNRKEEGDKR